MKKIIALLALIMLISGCAHHRVPLSQRLQLGMTKAEVSKVCGKPTQVGAMKNKDGKVIESFIYRQISTNAWTGTFRTMDTYVYFEEDKVINYGGEPIAFY